MRYKKLKGKELYDAIREAKKDPKFMKALNEFIKFHTS